MCIGREGVIKEFDERIDKLLELIVANIDVSPALSKKCERSHVVIPDNPAQTLLRSTWGVLRKCQAFRGSMHHLLYPTLVKFGELCKYIYDISQLTLEVEWNVQANYTVVQATPTPDYIAALFGLKGQKHGFYIHDKKNDKLFYADVHQFGEVLAKEAHEIDPEIATKTFFMQGESELSFCDLTAKGMLHIRQKTNHLLPPMFLDDKTYKVFKASKELMEWLRDDAPSDTYRYSSLKLDPVIADLRKAVHIGSMLKIVGPFLPALPADFSVTKYLDQANTGELSLNADMGALFQFLDKNIKRYEAMHLIVRGKEMKEQKEKKPEIGEEYPSMLLFKQKDEKSVGSDRALPAKRVGAQ